MSAQPIASDHDGFHWGEPEFGKGNIDEYNEQRKRDCGDKADDSIPGREVKFFRLKVLLWPVLLVIVALVGASALGAYFALSIPPLVSVESEEHNTQIVQSVTTEEQIVLVGLDIEGIDEKRQNGEFFGVAIPGSERATFLRYSFYAKLGIDGKQVGIEQTGEDSFVITIPEFIFIGIDKQHYEVAVESNGILSWTTAEIEEVEMVNTIFDDVKTSHLKSQKELLKDQARAFYTAIVGSVDPDAELKFEFVD